MATIQVKGLDEWLNKLQTLTDKSEGLCKRSVWEGGRVVGQSISAALHDIPVQDEYVRKDEMRTGIRSEEKDDIIHGFGLSKMRNTGGKISTQAGFKAGTKIRAVESGTSFMRKHPVVRPAVNRARAAAQAAMQSRFEEDIQNIMN